MTFTDEQLSAYLDGELSAAEMDKIEKALAEDSKLVDRFEKLASNDQLLKDAYQPFADQTIPANISDLLDEEDEKQIRSTAPLAAANDNGFWQRWSLPIAASVALFIGVGIGNFGSNQADYSAQQLAGVVDPQNPLHDILENQPSGKAIDLGRGDSAEVILTFADKDGTFCREFSITSTNKINRAIACREDQWNVKFSAQSDKPSKGSGYQTASSESDMLFDQFIDSQMQDDALDIAAEQQVIQNGWQE